MTAATFTDYRGYSLHQMKRGPGWRIHIHPPGHGLTVETMPNGPDLDAVLGEAREVVDREIEKKESSK